MVQILFFLVLGDLNPYSEVYILQVVPIYPHHDAHQKLTYKLVNKGHFKATYWLYIDVLFIFDVLKIVLSQSKDPH